MDNQEILMNLMTSGVLKPYQVRALMGNQAEKALVANSALYGPENPFDACTRQEFGYGIWTASNSKFWMWLNPAVIPTQRSLNFFVMDYRTQLEQAPGVSSDWCAVPTFTALPQRGCEVDYCFDPNRYYYTGRQTITPADLQKVCFQNPLRYINGTPINDQNEYEQFMMFQRQMTAVVRSIILDDSDDVGEEDGIAAFFENFATRHPELTSTCLTELSPVTVNLTGVDCTAILNSVYNRVWELQTQVGFLEGNPRIPDEYFVLLMNPLDAECVLRCQSCVLACNLPVVISPELMTPAGRQVFYDDYNNRLTGGAYGDGFFELRNGQKISIIRDWNLPRGTFYLLVRGWVGSQPNEMGLRVAINNWSDWVNSQRFSPGVRLTPLANGGLLYVVSPSGICETAHLRWNWRLFSNAPWAQTQFTNLAACTEVVDPSWASLPTLTGAVPCDQVPVELG